MEQGTPEWFDIKRGKVSATGIAKLQAKGKGVSREKYKIKVVLERITGKTAIDGYTDKNMERGIDLEGEARNNYEVETGNKVVEVGFIDHPIIPMYGVSPDGLVGDDGMCEIKVVQSNVMLDYIYDREIPTNYQKQMQSQMGTADRQWNDFVAFSPDMPHHLQLLVIRLERDNAVIQEQEVDVMAFLKEVEVQVQQLQEMEL
jgi:putative phage-type endonuclease